jgi:transcriptional regulator with XRE-family HTH domain
MLSQIERGISSPSIRMLRSICHALNIDGEVLFTSTHAQSPVGREFVVRANERQPISIGGVRKHRLTPQACSQLEGFLIDISADSVLDPNFVIQEGDKIGYVLKGCLRLYVGGLELMLETGDAYGFPTGQRFRWVNGWSGDTQILVINGKHFYA